MTPYYDDGQATFYQHDALSGMRELPAESAQCLVTSPPYWGLRKYAGEHDMVWEDDHCEHEWSMEISDREYHQTRATGRGTPTTTIHRATVESGFCTLCGAWRGAYGLEPTPEMYVEHSVAFLREIRRVLRQDGVVFWVVGDSYSGGDRRTDKAQTFARGNTYDLPIDERPNRMMGNHGVVKPKDLCLIPQRLAIAAQQGWYECLVCGKEYHGSRWGHVTDKTGRHHFVCPNCLAVRFVRKTEPGWWVRSIIIWSKPNPMPESVTDRPTESHEYIIMLTKSARYYWDAEAVREANHDSSWATAIRIAGGKERQGPKHDYAATTNNIAFQRGAGRVETGRNLRSVWEIATQPFGMEMCLSCRTVYQSAQYRRLPDRAGSKKCQCADVDYVPSWVPVPIDSEANFMGDLLITMEEGRQCEYCGRIYTVSEFNALPQSRVKVCRCGEVNWLSHFAVFPEKVAERCIMAASRVGDTVLDPFSGAGTTAWVAKRLGRRAIGFDMAEEYCALAVNRCRQMVMELET